MLVVVDSRLRDAAGRQHLRGRPAGLHLRRRARRRQRQAALEARGATVVCLPGPSGKVDLAAMLRDLARREVNELHVEAGHKLNGSLMREGLVDELLVYLAPKLVGEGPAAWPTSARSTDLGEAVAFEFLSSDRIGPDLRLVARIPGRDQF